MLPTANAYEAPMSHVSTSEREPSLTQSLTLKSLPAGRSELLFLMSWSSSVRYCTFYTHKREILMNIAACVSRDAIKMSSAAWQMMMSFSYAFAVGASEAERDDVVDLEAYERQR